MCAIEATLSNDLLALFGVLFMIFAAWLYLKRECEDSPLVRGGISPETLRHAGPVLGLALFGLGVEKFGNGVQAALLAIAILLTVALIWSMAARRYPETRLGRIFNWIVGRKIDRFAQPSYALGESLRRKGRISEAIIEIEAQLSKSPEDFTGQMLLAEIAALNSGDLTLAERTIYDILQQRGRSEAEIAFASRRLAEWRERLARAKEAAL